MTGPETCRVEDETGVTTTEVRSPWPRMICIGTLVGTGNGCICADMSWSAIKRHEWAAVQAGDSSPSGAAQGAPPPADSQTTVPEGSTSQVRGMGSRQRPRLARKLFIMFLQRWSMAVRKEARSSWWDSVGRSGCRCPAAQFLVPALAWPQPRPPKSTRMYGPFEVRMLCPLKLVGAFIGKVCGCGACRGLLRGGAWWGWCGGAAMHALISVPCDGM